MGDEYPGGGRGSRRVYRAPTPGGVLEKDKYKGRDEVELTINLLKGFRAVATRYDKRASVFHGTVTVAAIRIRLRT
ncbi:hypothetical protein ACFCWE_00775 [Streptomyces parvus]|uniref:hypothetical protein n=1 Tax=Streptomyces parvus TaxID=66428 RepID=UPI0035E23C38